MNSEFGELAKFCFLITFGAQTGSARYIVESTNHPEYLSVFKTYDRCIFCFNEILDTSKGDGEHIIPKNIYGFWRIYDICGECRRHFGDKIDQLALKNVHILNAMKRLGLPNSDKLYENLPYIGTDNVENRKIKMYLKDGKYRIKANIVDKNFLECSEHDWENFGIKWLEQNTRTKVSKEGFDKEVERLKIEYKALSPGETVHSKVLDYSIRKLQTRKLEVDNASLPSISPLIAKIVASFLWYALTPQQIASVHEFESLIKHARFDGELRKYLINWCSLLPEEEYQKYHRLRVHAFSCTLVVDITLLGYPNWRVVLSSSDDIVLVDHHNVAIEEVHLVLDFDDLDNRQKYVGYKQQNDLRPTYYKLMA